MARRDVLTGLYNRRTFDENIKKYFLLAKRKNSSLSMLFQVLV